MPTPEEITRIDTDILFKELLTGKASSSPETAFFEELINSKRLIFPSQIIASESQIPATAQAVPGVIEEITDLEMLHIPGANSTGFYHPNLAGIIPFTFGDGTSYLYQFKRQDDSIIPAGLNGLFFNPNAGVVYFRYGFPSGVSASQPIKFSGYRYIGPTGIPSGSSAFQEDRFTPTPGQSIFQLNSTPFKIKLAAIGPLVQVEGIDFQITDDQFTWLDSNVILDSSDLLIVQYYI